MAEETAGNPRAGLGERLLGQLSEARLPKFGRPRLSGWGPFELTSPSQVVLLAALSGLSGAGVLITLTSTLGDDGEGSFLWHGIAFVVLIILYRTLQRTLLRSTCAAVEDALDVMRTRIAAKVIALDLQRFEAIPRAELQAKMARHYDVISEATVGILGGLQSFILLCLTLVYLATLSPLAAALAVAVLGIAVHAYFASRAEIQSRRQGAAEAETELLASLGEITGGFKELRLSAAKRSAVLEELCAHSATSAAERTKVQGLFGDLFVFSNTIAFLLGGAVVFLIPALLGQEHIKELGRVTTIVLFIIGPLGAVVGAAQHFGSARFAVTSIKAFEEELDRVLDGPPAPPASLPPFVRLELEDVRFTHKGGDDDRAFAIGPLNLAARRGDVVFITGGNGSGKTTALRVLTGLYPADGGTIRLNGEPVTNSEGGLEAYRHLFGTVFADAHVFRRPYALGEERRERLNALLRRLEIADKLPEDPMEGYDPNALSTGQRKRLAMALTLADDREVFVFDEWAADQDPTFRALFYDTLLPELKAAGKTIIAVTHDDRYFDAADRRYHMDEGRMILAATS